MVILKMLLSFTHRSLVFFLSIENTAASRTENTDPLPNPWAPRGTGAAAAGAAATPNRQQQSTGAPNNQQQEQQQPPSAIPTGAAGSSPGLISPMMQNYMSQLVQNPRLLESVLNAPYMQPLMDSLAANPDISRQMVANNPMFANNPELREQMINALPAMMEQMRNPEVQTLMQNREALEAITQVQEGLKIKKKVNLNNSLLYLQDFNVYMQRHLIFFKRKFF
jgi:ubiquilin